MMYRRTILRSYAAPLAAALVLLSTLSVSTVQAQETSSWRQKTAQILDEPIFARIPYLRNIPFLGSEVKIANPIETDLAEIDDMTALPEISEESQEQQKQFSFAFTVSGALSCLGMATAIKYHRNGIEHMKGALIANTIELAKHAVRAQDMQGRVAALSHISRGLSASFLAEATRAYWSGGVQANPLSEIAKIIAVTTVANIGINVLMTIPWTIGYKLAQWRDRRNNTQQGASAVPAAIQLFPQHMQQVLSQTPHNTAARAA